MIFLHLSNIHWVLYFFSSKDHFKIVSHFITCKILLQEHPYSNHSRYNLKKKYSWYVSIYASLTIEVFQTWECLPFLFAIWVYKRNAFWYISLSRHETNSHHTIYILFWKWHNFRDHINLLFYTSDLMWKLLSNYRNKF